MKPAPKETLTKDDVAKILQVSRRQVQRYIADRKLECVRLGHKTLRIRPEALDRFMKRETY